MKRRKLERVVLSKQFLKDLLVPFTLPMSEIVDIEIKNDSVIIDYRKEGGVNNTA